MATGYWELKKRAKYSFNLKAANHQVILTSQVHDIKASAEIGIESVRMNGGDDGNFERKISSAGPPYLVLKASNGQVIGACEMYESAAARDNDIESVKTHCPITEMKDFT